MAVGESEAISPADLTNFGEEVCSTEQGLIHDEFVERVADSSHYRRIAVLIPAFNEELTIGTVVLDVKRYGYSVLVVNDGSRDRTSEIARLAGAEVIDHHKNGGKAAALRTGFTELKSRDYDVVVIMDGDGQHKVEDINGLVAPVVQGDADLVIGSRFLKKDNSIPYYRQVGQRVLNRVTNAGAPVKVSDTQSGFRALSRRALDNINFHSSGYAIEQDMIIHFTERGLRIKEVPISVRYDVPNGHKQGSISMGVGLLNNVIATVGYKRPLLLFGIPGLLFCSAGFIVGMMTLFELFWLGSWLFQALLAGFLMILGSTLAVSALSLNSLALLMRMSKAN